jgi:hypothetical protein
MIKTIQISTRSLMPRMYKKICAIPLDELHNHESLPDFDLRIPSPTHNVFYETAGDVEKTKILPGAYSFIPERRGSVTLSPLELKKQDLLESASHTNRIEKEIEIFESKLHVFKRLNRHPKRALLLYSQPGCGKTSTICNSATKRLESKLGQVVIFWDTKAVNSSTVLEFLSQHSEYSPECSSLLLVIEDIGGGEVDNYFNGPKEADASLLELLDGAINVFKVPTFIIATTNHPEQLLQALADRPGRFDEMIEIEPPNKKERVEITSFLAKRDLTKEEVLAIEASDGFSVAHLMEVVVRSELHDKTYQEVVNELKKHKKRVEEDFLKAGKKLGLTDIDTDI